MCSNQGSNLSTAIAANCRDALWICRDAPKKSTPITATLAVPFFRSGRRSLRKMYSALWVPIKMLHDWSASAIFSYGKHKVVYKNNMQLVCIIVILISFFMLHRVYVKYIIAPWSINIGNFFSSKQRRENLDSRKGNDTTANLHDLSSNFSVYYIIKC